VGSWRAVVRRQLDGVSAFERLDLGLGERRRQPNDARVAGVEHPAAGGRSFGRVLWHRAEPNVGPLGAGARFDRSDSA
jgi:hypothetical protein